MKSKRLTPTSIRKDEHLEVCFHHNVVYETISTGFDEIKLDFSLFPSCDPNDVNLSTEIIGKFINFPIIISGITGGSAAAKKINKAIASVCEEFQIAMGVGSQRAMIEHPELLNTYKVRDVAPEIPLFGNLGIAQFVNGYTLEEAYHAVSAIQADGLAIHVNPLQEFIQREGDKHFSKAKDKILELVENCVFPIMIKGVGTGLSANDANFLAKSNVSLIDVAGAGGTNWTKIEAIRNQSLPYLSHAFLEWGISSAQSLKNMIAAKIDDKQKIICSGGIWSGFDAVKALVLGADYVAFALPVIRALKEGGIDALRSYIQSYITEMKVTMAIVGKRKITELKGN
ncbi:MAG: type 2 isopentenyl-diphosphate Delta-isomerase [Candidatus Heimdallarchaeaceae archaeon]